MSTFESSIRQIPYKQEAVFNMLSDLSNIERIKDKLPEDKLEQMTFDNDSISVSVNPVGQIKLRIVERLFQSLDSGCAQWRQCLQDETNHQSRTEPLY